MVKEYLISHSQELLLATGMLAMAFSAKLRFEVRKRQDGVCDCCGEVADKLEIHHRRPQSMRGSDRIENAVGLCHECHAEIDKESQHGIYYPQVHTYKRYYPQGNGREN